MRNDMTQDRFGYFYRDNGDGTFDALSELRDDGTTPVVAASDIPGPTVILIRNGAATGEGDQTAARMATFLLRKRYGQAA